MQNIAIFMDKPDEGEIIALAAKVGRTAGDLNKYPTELSGGMAKRVAFLRLLLCGCDLALLDEPFVGLDRDLRDILVAMLVEKIERQGMNVQNVITLPTRCPNAIRLLKKPWWQESFRGFIIMSDRNLNF